MNLGRRARHVLHFVAALALLGLAASPGRAGEQKSFASGNRLGEVRLFTPEGDARALVFLFSDGQGWKAGFDQAAGRLAASGIVVALLDTTTILAHAAEGETDCIYLVSDIEALSKTVQRELGQESYLAPILAGSGQGATMAYASLAQAPAATVEGIVTVDAAPSLATSLPFCPGAPAARQNDGSFAYGEQDALPGWWLAGLRDSARDPFAWAGAIEAGETVQLEPGREAADALVDLVTQAALEMSIPDSGDLADLPLTLLPATQESPFLAVILSGDGGWRDLDKEIGEWLAGHGVPVVGLDSLRYFWTEKSPETIARDLTRIVRHYGRDWGRERVILVGYSFGAGVLPASIALLAENIEQEIVEIALLGLESKADFEFHVTGWLGSHAADARAVAPDAARLDMSKVQCVYGEEEEDTLCPDPLFAGAERIRTKGGHHFDEDYEHLARLILEGADRRLGLEGADRGLGLEGADRGLGARR